jgi:hypothetical protein
MRFLLLTVLAAVLMTGPAEAEQESFAVIGFGTASCGSWTADRRSGQALGSEQWALGFAAGMANGLGPNSGVDPLSGVTRMRFGPGSTTTARFIRLKRW